MHDPHAAIPSSPVAGLLLPLSAWRETGGWLLLALIVPSCSEPKRKRLRRCRAVAASTH